MQTVLVTNHFSESLFHLVDKADSNHFISEPGTLVSWLSQSKIGAPVPEQCERVIMLVITFTITLMNSTIVQMKLPPFQHIYNLSPVAN